MTDLNVTARFRRQTQPVSYEAAEAEITVGGVVSDPTQVGQFLDSAQRQVLAVLGKSHEFRPASSGSPKATVAAVVPAAPALSEQGPSSGTETVSGDRPAASSGEPAEKPDSSGAATAEKKPRGRPRKEATPPAQDALEQALADAAGKPEPNAAEIAGVEVKVDAAKDLPPVTHEEVQTACGAAAEKMGSAAKVRGLFKNYGNVSRVAEIDPDMLRPFLKDLAELVAKETAK